MSDPTAAVQGALAGAAISTGGLLMGAHVDALVAGLIAAVAVTIWMDQMDSRAKAAGAVIFAAMLAGYGSPVAAEYVAAHVDGIAGSDSLRMAMAVLLGALTPLLWPSLVNIVKSKAQGVQP